MNIKNGIVNIVSGLFRQIVLLVLGLILPRIILVNYGSEINGFMSSVTQLVTYLALLEVGVGTATLQALYKPISLNNKEDINSIMSATHKYYKKTGIIYGLIVIIFSILYPVIVKSQIPTIDVTLFVLLSGITGVLNYLFQGKYKILLQAEGKNYIITNMSTVISICTNIAKILLISMNLNIVIVQMSYVLFNTLQMIYIYIYIKRHYKWLDTNIKPNYDAISQSKSVMLHEISYMIFTHTDAIILTLMCDLKSVSVYSIYNMVFGQIESVINIFSTSIQYLLGQLYSKSLERYKKMYNIYELLFLIISFTFFAVTYIFITPFINLYTAGIEDTEYVLTYLPILFVIVRLLTSVRTITNNTIHVGGYFDKTKWIAIIEAILNLTATILLVKFLGIYGVLLGTIFALTFRIGYMLIYVNSKILKRNIKTPIIRIIINITVLFGIKFFIGELVNNIKNYITMICLAIIVTIVTLIIYILIYAIIEKSTFREILDLIKSKYNKKSFVIAGH